MSEEISEVVVEETSGDTGESGNFGENSADSLASDLAADLFPKDDSVEKVEEVEEQKEKPADKPVTEEVITRQPPKSWTKEMQTRYSALPPEVQDYVELREKQMADGLEKDRGDANLGRTMRDVMTPYRAMLQAQNVNESQAVQSLMNVHYRLTNLPPAEKTAYLASMAKSYGIDISNVPHETDVQIDPTVRKLQEELNGIKQSLTNSQQASINQAKERVVKDVESFASDPKHAYFDEVADDIATMIQGGHDLETAYEKAVWANPVTRQKEIARLQTESETSLKEKATLQGEAAKKAAALNVKSRDTSKVPTGPKATMSNLDSVMRETMREMKSKTH
jgi:hypothetical protein